MLDILVFIFDILSTDIEVSPTGHGRGRGGRGRGRAPSKHAWVFFGSSIINSWTI